MEQTLLQNIFGIVRRYKGRLTKAFIMVLFSNGLTIFNPLILRKAWATFATANEVAITSLIPWIAALLGVAITASYLKYLMRMEFFDVSRDVEKEVRSALFARMQDQSQSFFDRHGIGELLSRLTNDITSYRDLIGPGIMYPVFFLTLAIPGFIALFYISADLALVALIPLLAIPLLNLFLHRKVFHVAQKVQQFLGHMSNMTQEHFAGIKIVKSYVIESRLLEIFDKMCQVFSVLNIKLSCLQGLLFPLLSLIVRIITVVLVMFSGIIMLKSWETLSSADFISFMWIQSYIFFPVLMLAWVMPIYERGRAAYDRIVEIYNEPFEIQDNAKSNLRIIPGSDILFKDLTFFYPNTKRASLSQINLHIKGSSFVGFTGPVGGGKTTLFRILNREYEIPTGKLFIGNHEIHEYSLRAIRDEMVMVEQRAFLFSKSVAENVKFGKWEASQEELELVADYADLHNTIMSFPQRYDTLVGERGESLSGGQKQRVALARAFLVDRSILLLDDIFSAVDPATEQKIFGSIQKYFRGKTVLLITHRISVLNQMDRVIYIANGQIVEDGTPAELIEKRGYYAALHELQGSSNEQRAMSNENL